MKSVLSRFTWVLKNPSTAVVFSRTSSQALKGDLGLSDFFVDEDEAVLLTEAADLPSGVTLTVVQADMSTQTITVQHAICKLFFRSEVMVSGNLVSGQTG